MEAVVFAISALICIAGAIGVVAARGDGQAYWLGRNTTYVYRAGKRFGIPHRHGRSRRSSSCPAS